MARHKTRDRNPGLLGPDVGRSSSPSRHFQKRNRAIEAAELQMRKRMKAGERTKLWEL